MATDSVVFEQAFSPGPRTPSSMPVIFTGEFFQNRDQGVYRNWEEKRSRWRERRARIGRHMSRFRTIPELLRDCGYATGGVTANPWTTEATNFDAGFDVFRTVAGRPGDGWTPLSPILERLEGPLDIDWNGLMLSWPDYFETVLEVRDSLREPYFLWVFLLDPHQPYIAPGPYREENSWIKMVYGNLRYNQSYSYTDTLPARLAHILEAAYRDSVRSVDGFVEKISQDLAEDDPVFVLHADHGEAFREHGTYGHRPQLYAENIHVPLLVNGLDRSSRIPCPLSLRILPELLVTIGDSLVDLDPKGLTEEFVLSKTEETERISVRNNHWAYIRSTEHWDYVHGLEAEELYRLVNDPGERDNVIERFSEVSSCLLGLLNRYEAHLRECADITRAIETIEV